MSVDDTIAQRRLAEDFCKRRAACLVSNVTDASLWENALRATFAGCLTNEAKENDGRGKAYGAARATSATGQQRWLEQHRRR